MAYLADEEIDVLLKYLSTLEDDTLLISEVCLATGARWGEAEGLSKRKVRNRLIHFTKAKSSNNRSIPISDDLYKRLQKALPFESSYDAFRRAVAAISLDLPWAVDARAVSYHCQSLREEGRLDPHAAKGAWSRDVSHDTTVRTFQSGTHGRGGESQPHGKPDWTLWLFRA